MKSEEIIEHKTRKKSKIKNSGRKKKRKRGKAFLVRFSFVFLASFVFVLCKSFTLNSDCFVILVSYQIFKI